jgi:hypothetical protein
MNIIRSLNVALLYLFLSWSFGLFYVGKIPYPGLYNVYLALLVIIYLVNNLGALFLVITKRQTYARLNFLGAFGLLVAIVSMIIWVKSY